ncbi:MAG: hypothetical protein V4695_03925 [Pseudomonadota bacterium]
MRPSINATCIRPASSSPQTSDDTASSADSIKCGEPTFALDIPIPKRPPILVRAKTLARPKSAPNQKFRGFGDKVAVMKAISEDDNATKCILVMHNPKFLPNVRDDSVSALSIYGVDCGRKEQLATLLQNNDIDVNRIYSIDPKQFLVLWLAIEQGFVDVVQAHLEKEGIAINSVLISGGLSGQKS